MIHILRFFIDYAIIIYFLLIIGLIFAARSYVRARHEMGGSLFGLEKATAHHHTSQSVAAISLVIFLAIAELVLIVFLAPNVPAFSLLITPTMNPLYTPTSTISPGLMATISVTTPLSSHSPQKTGCIPGQIMITSPKPGDVVHGQIVLTGTVNIPNFGFYKYEFAPLGTDIWLTIQADRKIKQEESLGSWDTSEVTPGDYNLRLVVTDNQGYELPPCVVPLRIAAP
jgi:hypothetical protein